MIVEHTFDNFTIQKYKIKVPEYKVYLLKHCIQAYVDNKKTKFILKGTRLADEIIEDAKDFMESINDKVIKNKSTLIKEYDEWCKNKPKLTKESFAELFTK